MPYYIQRRNTDTIETIDEYTDSKEAFAAAREHNLRDSSAHYYVMRRPCQAWLSKD